MADHFDKKSRERAVVRAGLANRTVVDDVVIPALREKWIKITVGVNDSDKDINITDGAETDSSIDLPTPAVVTGIFLEVLTAEATGGTKTLDVGLLSSESGGDADGFLDGASVAATGTVVPIYTDGSETGGALLRDDVGTTNYAPVMHPVATAVSVTATAGSADFAELVANIYIRVVEPEGE